MTSFRRTMIVALAALGFAAVAPARSAHAGFYCKTTRTIRLTPEPGAPFKLAGRAEIDQCYGLSFLRVVVEGNAPDGTTLTPGFQSFEPYLGNAFVMTHRHGDGLSGPEGIFDDVTGRTLVIFDDAFDVLLSGTF